jgi:hypothetical protein
MDLVCIVRALLTNPVAYMKRQCKPRLENGNVVVTAVSIDRTTYRGSFQLELLSSLAFQPFSAFSGQPLC